MTLLEIFAQTKILAVIFDNTVIQKYNFLFSKSEPWDRQTEKKAMPHYNTLVKFGFN